jgi:Ala-tRNA(Pro) deacylase
MSAYSKIVELLQKNSIQYEELRHEPVRTSEEAAKIRPGMTLSQGAKALIIKCREKGSSEKFFCMVVLSGSDRFNSKKIKQILNLSDVMFASEAEVLQITDGVQPGGVPPFGNIFGIKVIVDQTLLKNDKIAFNAGDRSITIIMKSLDWLNIVHPEIHNIV